MMPLAPRCRVSPMRLIPAPRVDAHWARPSLEEQTMPQIAIDPDVRSHLTLGRLSNRSRASQTIPMTRVAGPGSGTNTQVVAFQPAGEAACTVKTLDGR
jgi:hypothetical protein